MYASGRHQDSMAEPTDTGKRSATGRRRRVGDLRDLAETRAAAAACPLALPQALPPEHYPRLIEIAKAATRLGADREFRAGLDIVMAGLEARLIRQAC